MGGHSTNELPFCSWPGLTGLLAGKDRAWPQWHEYLLIMSSQGKSNEVKFNLNGPHVGPYSWSGCSAQGWFSSKSPANKVLDTCTINLIKIKHTKIIHIFCWERLGLHFIFCRQISTKRGEVLRQELGVLLTLDLPGTFNEQLIQI